MIKKFAYNSNEHLSNGFTVSEFRCKCGKKHDTIIDTELIDKLEKLRSVLGCSKIVVNSGYRCSAHDKAVGGNGEGQHTKGTAADIKCYDKYSKVINTKKSCLHCSGHWLQGHRKHRQVIYSYSR